MEFWIMATALIGVISSQSLISLLPGGHYVFTPGGNATLICVSNPLHLLESVVWLVNGTASLSNHVESEHEEFPGARAEILRLINLPGYYNVTWITCVATLSGTVTNANASLLLQAQGLLSAVGDLYAHVSDSSISLTWTPPFTLDITGVNPNIQGYYIDVINSTSSTVLTSQRTINVTEFCYPLHPDSGCNDYEFTVIPVNIVGNGMASTVRLSQFLEPSEVSSVLCTMVPANTTTLEDEIGRVCSLQMSAPMCNGLLTSEDLYTGDVRHLTVVGVIVTLHLTVKHHYNITVVTTNINGSTISSITISTHDTVNATVYPDTGNKTVLTTVYSEHSDASGALFSFVFITDSGDVDFTRSALLALDRNASHSHTLPFNLYPGHYRVYVYDIEHDGTLSSGVGYPAVRNELEVISYFTSNSDHQQAFDCALNSSSGLIWAECSYNDTSPAAVTGFQIIAQLGDSGEVHKLYVNQSTTPVTVLVERAGEYQVSIFAIEEGTGILGSDVVVGYAKKMTVYEMRTTVSTIVTTHTSNFVSPSTSTTFEQMQPTVFVLALSCALGVITLLAIGVIGILGYKLKSLNSKLEGISKAQIPLDTIPDDFTASVAVASQQLYEEIKDVNPLPSNIMVPESPPEMPAVIVTASHSPEYEVVKPAGVRDAAGSYHLTLCSAYGVPLETGR